MVSSVVLGEGKHTIGDVSTHGSRKACLDGEGPDVVRACPLSERGDGLCNRSMGGGSAAAALSSSVKLVYESGVAASWTGQCGWDVADRRGAGRGASRISMLMLNY
jgi:L-asparaginase/Glu-tRNA(Gln) amidotransferase subunit D